MGSRKEIIPLTRLNDSHPKEMPFEIPGHFSDAEHIWKGLYRELSITGIYCFRCRQCFSLPSRCIYAISPAKPRLFLESFSRILQLDHFLRLNGKRPVDWLLNPGKTGTHVLLLLDNFVILLIALIGFRFSSHQVIQGILQQEFTHLVENVLLIPIFGVPFCFFDFIYRNAFINRILRTADFFGSSVLVLLLLVLSGIAVFMIQTSKI